MKHIKLFSSGSELNNWIASSEFSESNVCLVGDTLYWNVRRPEVIK